MVKILRGNRTLFSNVLVCDTFFSKGLGLMFRKSPLSKEECLLFSGARELPPDFLGIHMHFCNFPITVAWLDKEGKVVDSVKAVPAELLKPETWKVHYPKRGAKDILECSDRIKFRKGEKLKLVP